jgi:hypothetical protein
MSNINPSLLENVFTVTYKYAPDVSGGIPYYKPLINITNVDSINVNTIAYSNIAFGDAFGNVFVGDQAGVHGTNRSNTNGFGQQVLDYADNIRNVNAMGFSVMNQADDLSNVVGIGTYVGSNMSNVSNSIFVGDFVAGELSNTSGEIFIGTRVAENLVASDGQNIVIGNEGLNTATSIGRGNILMGAGVATSGLTPGSSNVVIGTGSAVNMTTNASANVILGAASGLNILNGSNNILIGYEVDPTGDVDDYLQIGNLIRGNQSISYVSIMTDISRTGCLTLGNNTIIYPPGDASVISNLSARLILGPAPNTTNIAYSSVIENLTVSFASGYHSKLNFYTHPTAVGPPSLAMTIDENQQVGIGTINPGNQLTLNQSPQFGYSNRATNDPSNYQLGIYDSNEGGLFLGSYLTGVVGVASTIQSSDTFVDTSTNPTIHGKVLLLNPLGGNVGIGTDTPTQTLDVSGIIQSRGYNVRATYESNDQMMILMKYDTGCNCAVFAAYNNSGGSASNIPILFQQLTASLSPPTYNRMIIDGNGNVGINTITPSTRLEVAGTISSTTFVGNGTIPVGGIIMWSGVSIPTGWALCDGTGGTPDLRNRFIIGAGSTYAVGTSGGSTTIEASNLPKHAHYIVDPGHSHDVVLSGLFSNGQTSTNATYVGQSLGGGAGSRSNDPNAALTNTTGITISENGPILDSNYNQTLQTAYLQPYYALAYIMRTV